MIEFLGRMTNINEEDHGIGFIRLNGIITIIPYSRSKIIYRPVNYTPVEVLKELRSFNDYYIAEGMKKSPLVGVSNSIDYRHSYSNEHIIYDIMTAMFVVIPNSNYITQFRVAEFDDDVDIKYQGSFEIFRIIDNKFYCFMLFDSLEDRLETNTILSLYNFEVLGEFSKDDFPIDLNNENRHEIFKW